MLEQIAKIVERYEDLERQMASPEALADYQKMTTLAQERSELEPLVQTYRQHACGDQGTGRNSRAIGIGRG